MIPYGKQTIDQEDIDAVISVLKSDFLTTGPVVRKIWNRPGKLHGNHPCGCRIKGNRSLALCHVCPANRPRGRSYCSTDYLCFNSQLCLLSGRNPRICRCGTRYTAHWSVNLSEKSYRLNSLQDFLYPFIHKARRTNPSQYRFFPSQRTTRRRYFFL